MKTKQLVQQALFAALIAVATGFLKIPGPQGYMHLGDGVIFAAALWLGPAAAIPAALGSALADLLAGYSPYIPATLVIKGCLGFLAGRYVFRLKRWGLQVLLLTVCEFSLVLGGYFVYEWWIYPGSWGAAIGNSLFTFWQCAAGIVIGGIAVRVFPKRM